MQGLGTRKSCGDDTEFERKGNNTNGIISEYGKSRHPNDTIIWHCVRVQSFILL